MANTAPLLTGITSPVTFAEDTVNVAPKLIDSNVTFADPDNNFNGGTLTVSGLLAEDAVTIRYQGTAAGQIGVSGSNVTFGGAVIGSFTGGTGSTLTVTFNASATAAAIDALIQNLTYGNSSDAPAATRTLTIAVTDTGSQTFTETNAQFAYTPVFIKEGDVDGDGDLDRIETVDLKIHYNKNIGSATAPVYEEQTGAANPFDGIRLGSFDTTALSDVDGDGDLDLVTWTPGPGGFFYNFFLNSGNIATAATVTVAVTQENDAPKLTDVSSAVTFAENTVNAAPQLIDANVTFTDPESNFNGGTLVVSGLLAEDSVAIRNQGTGSGQIGVSGTNITYGGIVIGSFTGGTAGATLSVTFNGSATAAAIDALIQNLTYANSSNTPTADRTLSIIVTDADGATDVPNFAAQTGTDNPFNGINVGFFSTPTLADIDGDGDLDAVVGEDNGSVSFLENTGTATAPAFTRRSGTDNPFNGISPGFSLTPALADVDGDGDLDAVVGDAFGSLTYLENTGTATAAIFTVRSGAANPFANVSVTDNINISSHPTPSLGDLDGDGDLDLLVGEFDGVLNYFENTGTATAPAFTSRSGIANPFNSIELGLFSSPTLADVDGDGDLDAIVGRQGGDLSYFENTGTATVPRITARIGDDNPFNGFSVGSGSAPALGDLDSDGDIDAVVGAFSGFLSYFENALDNRVKITVAPENDAPTLNKNEGLTMAEGATSVITASKLGYSDAEQSDGELVYTITSLTAGTVLKSNVTLAVNGTFTQADINGGVIEFRHDGSEGTAAGFGFSLSDGTAPINSTFDITVTPVNDVPVITSGATGSVAENAAASTIIYTAAASDPDAGDSTAWSLTGADKDLLTLDASGNVRLKASANFETKSSYSFSVVATDNGNLTATKAVTVSVTDVNEAPTAVALTNPVTTLAENTSTASRRKIADINITDDALGAETITLGGADAALFEVVGGALYIKAGSILDFETNPKLDVTVTAQDPTVGGPVTTAHSISLTDVNEAPNAVAFTNVLASIAENASTAARIKVANIAITDDALGSEIITLAGADAAKFEVINGVLYIKAGTVLNYEADEALDVTVNVNDPSVGGAIDASRALSVKVTDVQETITGTINPETLNGGIGSDRILGSGGNDTINGGAGNDVIMGGAGADELTGGDGADQFVFTSTTDSAYKVSGSAVEGGPLVDAGSSLRDVITDFTVGIDRINVSVIDANENLAGDQAFAFRGTGNFAGTGSIVYRQFDNTGTATDRTIVYFDTTGDGRSDMLIELTGLKTLTAADFIL